MTRKIIHVDMDAFYASVEQRDDPSLKGRPVIVGYLGNRSVVCAASYEARKFGVRSAIPMSRARRLCPDGIYVEPHFDRYRDVSRQIREIFLRHTPLVEPLSLDEAYLDVTEELTGIPTATETASIIRKEILESTSLTASAGVAPNKFLAKIASDWKKPNGLFVIKPHHISTFLPPLPVVRLPGVGAVTGQQLAGDGIVTVGDLLRVPQDELRERYGKFGDRLWGLARGIDEHPVEPDRPSKSVSSEDTFDVDLTLDEVRPIIAKEADRVWKSIEKSQRRARTVTVKLRSANFQTATRRETLPEALSSIEQLVEVATRLLGRFAFGESARYRLAGVGVSNFLDEVEQETGEDSTLFEGTTS